MYGLYIGPQGNQEITVNTIKIEGDKYVFIVEDGQFTKIVKTDEDLSNQTAFHYTGRITQYTNSTLIPNTGYNIKKK